MREVALRLLVCASKVTLNLIYGKLLTLALTLTLTLTLTLIYGKTLITLTLP